MLRGLVILAVFIALAQKPLPVNGDQKKQQSQAHTEAGDPPAPSTASEFSKESATNAERYAYYKSHPKEYLKAAVAPTNASNWVLAALGAIGGYIGIRTIRTIKRQADQVEANERARIVITPKIWSPPLYPLWEQSDPTPVTIEEMHSVVHICPLRIKNFGKTPSLIDEICSAYVHIKHPLSELPRKPTFTQRHPQGGRLLVEGKSITVVQTLGPKGTLTKDEVLDIRNNKAFLYVYVSVKYRDVYKKRRKTLVGYVYNFPQGGLASIEKAAFDIGGPKSYTKST